MGAGAELEHHRREPQPRDRVARGRRARRRARQGRGHEDPHPPVVRSDEVLLGQLARWPRRRRRGWTSRSWIRDSSAGVSARGLGSVREETSGYGRDGRPVDLVDCWIVDTTAPHVPVLRPVRGTPGRLRRPDRLAVAALFVRPETTDRYFAWTIRPPLTAAFLGAGLRRRASCSSCSRCGPPRGCTCGLPVADDPRVHRADPDRDAGRTSTGSTSAAGAPGGARGGLVLARGLRRRARRPWSCCSCCRTRAPGTHPARHAPRCRAG